MRLAAGRGRALTRQVLDHDLPSPVYAAVGLVDRVANDVATASDSPAALVGAAWRLTSAVVRTPRRMVTAARQEYDQLVGRGQVRSVEIAAEHVVRQRVSRFEDRVAPRAARATVRWNRRRQRWAASPAARRTATARRRAADAWQRARQATERFARFNAPVLLDEYDPGPDPGHS